MSVTGISANRLELLQIADAVAREKSIEKEIVIEAIEEAIQKAARSRYGAEHDIRVHIDTRTGEMTITRVVTVVADGSTIQLLVMAGNRLDELCTLRLYEEPSKLELFVALLGFANMDVSYILAHDSDQMAAGCVKYLDKAGILGPSKDHAKTSGMALNELAFQQVWGHLPARREGRARLHPPQWLRIRDHGWLRDRHAPALLP